MSWGPSKPHTWQPKNSKTVKAEKIRRGDVVLNSTCSAWYLIKTVDVDLIDGKIEMTGREVISGKNTTGQYELGAEGRLTAVRGENRILGY